MKNTIIILLFLCVWSASLAQSGYSIRGTVEDISLNILIRDVAVSVLNEKDSILQKFTWTGSDGSFSIGDLSAGKYILLVTFPDYADYTEQFTLDQANPMHDFGRLFLKTRAQVLAEVIIRGRSAIVIKGDTTEFNAEKFVVQPNSKVEDLLKQFPGIEIDQNGRITAQGKTVNRVLVDGEEFFGDDPTLVTRNIRGDMVDKIQVYDAKADNAKLTGIDDGKRITTMNVVLKEDKKNGYFGKTDAGLATSNRYQGQGMFNTFRTKSKVSVYGTIGNTGKIGLAADDGNKIGVSSFLAAGVYQGTIDELETFSGRYDGRGLPLVRSAGAHYDSKWNKDKQSINVNYRAGSLDLANATNSVSQNPLPSGITIENKDQTSSNSMFRQRLDGNYSAQLDSLSVFRITFDGTLRNSTTRISETGSLKRGNDTFLNSSSRALTNDADLKTISGSLGWIKKFMKSGRALGINITAAYTEEAKKGFINTSNSFYSSLGGVDSVRSLDQFRTADVQNSVLEAGLSWSQQISSTTSFNFGYQLSLNTNNTGRRTFNKSAGGNYTTPNNEYTNNLRYKMLSNQGRAGFSYLKNKYRFYTYTTVAAVRYLQNDRYTGKDYNRNYLNSTINIQTSYRPSQQRTIGLNFDGNNTQPTIDQLRVLKVNDDPLNITLGNADLKPSYRGGFYFFYSSNKPLANRSFNMSLGSSLTFNQIVLSTFTDAAGKTTLQYVNYNGKKPGSYSGSIGFNQKLKKSEVQLGVSLRGGTTTVFSYINNVVSKGIGSNYGVSFSASKSKLKKYSYSVSISPTYYRSIQSLQNSHDNRLIVNSSGSFTVYLPGKTELVSNATYLHTQTTETFGQVINPLIWNTSVSKKFLKGENLKLSISGNDLLKQNVGFSRGSSFRQTSYQTIQRYFMGSITWDFSKMGPVKPKN